ncbi:Uma2 family endonuclease [Sorangium cellulosum]|uniref:Uma2 family endonuclease n=1 Tax=Sorangium cellulosum TaxID=56 RepID=UPI003D9A5C68
MTSLAFAMPAEIVDPSVVAPPGDLDSNELPMESYQHLIQMLLLLESLELFWKERTDYFAAGNLTIYFSPRQLKSEHFRGPDFFVVLGTERRSRKSWVVWEEDGRYPNVIVEVLSESTARVDRGLKKQTYQDVFRTPDYFWFDPATLELSGFHLVDGQYQPLSPDASGRLWSAQLGLFLGVEKGQLRFFTPAGELVPAGLELAQRAEAAEQRAESAEQRAARLAEKLRELGVDPDTLK